MMTIPTTTAIGGTMYEGGWVISNAYTVTAPSERLPDAMKLFGIVLASYRVDPHFFNTVYSGQGHHPAKLLQGNWGRSWRQAGLSARPTTR